MPAILSRCRALSSFRRNYGVNHLTSNTRSKRYQINACLAEGGREGRALALLGPTPTHHPYAMGCVHAISCSRGGKLPLPREEGQVTGQHTDFDISDAARRVATFFEKCKGLIKIF